MKVPKPKKLPSGSWYIQLRLDGKSFSVTRQTEKDCVHAAELIKAEYRAGQKQKLNKKDEMTVSEAIEDFIGARSNVLSPATIKAYRSIQKHRFQGVMNRKISDSIDWQKEVDKESVGLNAKTVKNSVSLIRSSLKAQGVELPDLKLPQLIHKDLVFLTWEQIPLFLNAIKGHPCEMAALLGLHSLRRSEILALKKDSVKNGIIYVYGAAVVGEDGKLIQKKENKNTSSRREVPIMIPRLLDLIQLAPEGRLVTSYPTSTYNQINRICEKHILPKVGVHGLRHSFASLAHHLRLPELETMCIGGWSDRNTVHKIYTHLDRAELLAAENKMAAFYNEIADKNADNLKE